MFLSSADWMPRNLLRRVEVMFPVEAQALRDQIRREVIDPALADTAFAYEMAADGSYARRVPAAGEAPRAAQADVLERTVGQTATAAVLSVVAPTPAPAAVQAVEEPVPEARHRAGHAGTRETVETA